MLIFDWPHSDFNPTSTNFFWHTGPGNRPLRTAIQHIYKVSLPPVSLLVPNKLIL